MAEVAEVAERNPATNVAVAVVPAAEIIKEAAVIVPADVAGEAAAAAATAAEMPENSRTRRPRSKQPSIAIARASVS